MADRPNRRDKARKKQPNPVAAQPRNPLDDLLQALAADASPRVRAWAKWLKGGDEGDKEKKKPKEK